MTVLVSTLFTRAAGVEAPIVCGAMYPCSNPELVAAVSEAGGLGVVQPLSLTYVHGYELRAGLRRIRALTDKPIGFNVIVEKSSRIYEERMRRWVDVALAEGVRFFVSALGKPDWVVRAVHAAGGVVYHDVTQRSFALRALEGGVDGFICVNARAGGHAGTQTPQELFDELSDLGVPLICAGGVGGPEDFVHALDMGYAGVQLGTRFIATHECSAHEDYKRAIVAAQERDIVLTDKISGIPVSVIKTPYVERVGTRAGFLARRLLRHARFKHYMRLVYTLKAAWQLKRASLRGASYLDYFQAGKSVATIASVVSVKEVVDGLMISLTDAARAPTGR